MHFFQFANDALFDRVKQAVTAFFQELTPTSESYLGNSTRKNSGKIVRNSVNTRKNSGKMTVPPIRTNDTLVTKFEGNAQP